MVYGGQNVFSIIYVEMMRDEESRSSKSWHKTLVDGEISIEANF